MEPATTSALNCWFVATAFTVLGCVILHERHHRIVCELELTRTPIVLDKLLEQSAAAYRNDSQVKLPLSYAYYELGTYIQRVRQYGRHDWDAAQFLARVRDLASREPLIKLTPDEMQVVDEIARGVFIPQKAVSSN